MRNLLFILLLFLAVLAMAQQTNKTPVLRGQLQSDFDGNNYSITNVKTLGFTNLTQTATNIIQSIGESNANALTNNDTRGPTIASTLAISSTNNTAELDFNVSGGGGVNRSIVNTPAGFNFGSAALQAGNVQGSAGIFSGLVSSTIGFAGDGSGLTNVPPSPLALTNNQSTLITGAAGFRGDGSQLTNLSITASAAAMAGAAMLASNNVFSGGSNSITGAFTGNGGGLTNVLRGIVTPYQFGAVGDGVTDDTVALQKWLDFASSNNFKAFLPPAIGQYWKVTDTLVVTNLNGFVIEGAGGAMHNNSDRSHSRINMTGVAKPILLITNNTVNSDTVDSVIIKSVLFTDDTYVFGTSSIVFGGWEGNTDACKLDSCGFQGFGTGLLFSNVANINILNCSAYNNGDGFTVNSVLAHNIHFAGCISTGNRSNALHIIQGHGSWDCGDLVTIPSIPGSHNVTIDGGVFEINHGTMEGHSGGANVVMNGGLLRLTAGSASQDATTANSESIAISNSSASLILCGFACGASDSSGHAIAAPVLVAGAGRIVADTPQTVFVYDATYGESPSALTPTLSSFIKYAIPGLTGDSSVTDMGFTVQDRTSGSHETKLMFGAHLKAEAGVTTQTNIDLLQYSKDNLKGTVTTNNGALSGVLKGDAGRGVTAATAETDYVTPSGSGTLANKTLTTPTIASFANATHNHQNAGGGGQLAEGALSLSDVTTDDVSTSKHGFAPRLPNDATKYLDGTGAYSVPVGGGSGSGIVTNGGTGINNTFTNTTLQNPFLQGEDANHCLRIHPSPEGNLEMGLNNDFNPSTFTTAGTIAGGYTGSMAVGASYSFIAGGYSNRVGSSIGCFAGGMGSYVTSLKDNCFVWADGSQLPASYIPAKSHMFIALATNGFVLDGGSNVTVNGSVIITNTLSFQTNAGGTAPNFGRAFLLCPTNASFTLLSPTGVDATKTLAQTTVLLITNSAGSGTLTLTPPSNVHTQGVWLCTNVTKVDFFCYGGTGFTNATATPLW